MAQNKSVHIFWDIGIHRKRAGIQGRYCSAFLAEILPPRVCKRPAIIFARISIRYTYTYVAIAYADGNDATSDQSPRPAAATSRYVCRDASGNSPHAGRRSPPPPRDRPPIPRREKPPRRIARQRGFSRWRAGAPECALESHNGFSTVSRRRSRFFCSVQSRGALTASLPKLTTETRRAPTSAVCSAASPARRRVSRTPPRTRTRA